MVEQASVPGRVAVLGPVSFEYQVFFAIATILSYEFTRV